MSFRKTMLWVAAALMVAGVWGMGWAQGKESQGSANMTTGLRIANVAEISVIPKGTYGDELIATVPSPPTATKFGSLGIVKVKTNSNLWDVEMTTRYGGKLVNPKSIECRDTVRLDGWGNPTSTVDNVCDGAPVFLRWNNGVTADTVVLNVAIGLAKSGKALGNTGAMQTLFPIVSATMPSPMFIPPVGISKDDILASGKDAGGAQVSISFADSLGAAGERSSWGTFDKGIYGDSSSTTATDPTNWAYIKTNGFPAPKFNYEPQEEYFYVDVGIPKSTYDALSGNKNGTFEETFYFELMARF